MEKFPSLPPPPEEPIEELPPPPDEPPVLKRSVDEIFIKPETPPSKESVEPPKVISKPKKLPSKKQLEHLARIREKSNIARAKKVAEREAKKVTIKEEVTLDTTIHNGEPKGVPIVQPPPPPTQTIIQQGITEERVNQMIQASIQATRQQIERENAMELQAKEEELKKLNKEMERKQRVKALLKRR